MGTYIEQLANNESQIYFMREKNIEKSIITIEVYNGKIVQARTKFNQLPSMEINEFLKK